MYKITPGIRNFIQANRTYFIDLVFNQGFSKGEVHYYVAEQIGWYNHVLNTKSEQPNEPLWQDIHKIMRNTKVRWEDMDVITEIIWGWKKYGVYIPNVTVPAKKKKKPASSAIGELDKAFSESKKMIP